MHHAVYALCLLFATTGIGHAQGDKTKPNTLTPKEIADGWILLFDGETTFGWHLRYATSENPKFKAADGSLHLTGGGTGDVNFHTPLARFELQFEYKTDGKDCWASNWTWKKNESRHCRSRLAHAKDWTKAKVIYRDGKVSFDGGGLSSTLGGSAVVEFHQSAPSNLWLRNIKLRPLNTKPLFSGKDLAGWKEFPGKKSKFTVTDKGEIHLKDGPGDLQTVGKYKDFILQLECKSNGKHLNSGIFFRCKDGEYQNGYEAQIFNKFSKDATQKYQVEEYDPKTNKLIGKKEVMSPAFDYGTGAIYRRVPARKEMAKDGEWFTMTIVAHGNHIATWVNGVQVVDWTDNRPKSDNPRNGCRLEAGHISIQGHDSTTDLSFRNIRIAELK
jgi:hypothetical protein